MPDERITSAPPPTAVMTAPPAATPAAAGRPPAARGGAAAPRWMVWVLALVAFAVGAITVNSLWYSQDDPPKAAERGAPAVLPLTPLHAVAPQGAPGRNAGTGFSGDRPLRWSPATQRPAEQPAPAATPSAPSGRYAYAGDLGPTGGLDYSRYYDPSYRPPVGEHWVNGYYRRDGTYVRGHYRTNPDGSFWNNWSSRGNVNPHTGKVGNKLPPAWSGGSYRRR